MHQGLIFLFVNNQQLCKILLYFTYIFSKCRFHWKKYVKYSVIWKTVSVGGGENRQQNMSLVMRKWQRSYFCRVSLKRRLEICTKVFIILVFIYDTSLQAYIGFISHNFLTPSRWAIASECHTSNFCCFDIKQWLWSTACTLDYEQPRS